MHKINHIYVVWLYNVQICVWSVSGEFHENDGVLFNPLAPGRFPFDLR